MLHSLKKFFTAFALRIIVTGTILVWLIAAFDSTEIKNLVSLLSLSTVAYACILHTIVFFLGGIRWWLLFRWTDHEHKKTDAIAAVLPSYYMGIFFNNLLPSSMGGDIVRTVHLTRLGFRGETLLGSAAIDRVIGLLVMLVLSGAGLALSSLQIFPTTLKWIVFITTLMLITIVLALFSNQLNKFLDSVNRQYGGAKILSFVIKTAQICHSYRLAPYNLAVATVLGLLAQCLAVFVYYLIARDLSIDLSLSAYFTIVPLALLAASLPISVGGLGVREGASVALFVAAGVNTEAAGALSVGYLFVLWLTSMPGGLVTLYSLLGRRPAPS